MNECRGVESVTLQKLQKEDFLEIVGQWYDQHYHKVYEHYLSVGKPPPVRLPMRANVLDEYLGKLPAWKTYKKLSQAIREYRNVIVHNYQIASIQFSNGLSYVPMKEKIQHYKKWKQVFHGASNQDTLRCGFIIREEQMALDIRDMMIALNNLWEKPISDMDTLLYKQRNASLLTKYNISRV